MGAGCASNSRWDTFYGRHLLSAEARDFRLGRAHIPPKLAVQPSSRGHVAWYVVYVVQR